MVVKVSKPEINVREKISELDKPSGIAGQAMLAAETPLEQFNLISAGRRNLFQNGAMTVWQRGNGPTAATNSNCITADRWKFFTSGSGGAYTTERSAGHLAETGHDTALKVVVTTADTSIAGSDYYSFLQRIEAQDVQQLQYGTNSAKHLTFSFWVRASKPGTNTVFITKEDSTTWRFVREFTINSADTWEYKTITFPPLTASTGGITNDNGTGLQIGWILKYGSSYAGAADEWTTNSRFTTSNAVNNMDTVGNTFYVTGVQVEVGKVATPFEHRSYGEELALCQRYTIVYGGPETRHLGTGSMYTAANVNFSIHTPVTMRAAPALIKTINGSGTWLQVYVGSTGNNSNPTPQLGEGGSTNIFRIYAPGTGLNQSVGSGAWIQVMAGASLELNAEL